MSDTVEGMVVVAGTISFETQEARDGAVAASVDLQRSTRSDEPGCLAYCFGADPAEPTVVQVYELWEDAESLVAHFVHPNYLAMRDTLRSFRITGAANRAYLVARDEPVYGPDATIRSSFFADAE